MVWVTGKGHIATAPVAKIGSICKPRMMERTIKMLCGYLLRADKLVDSRKEERLIADTHELVPATACRGERRG